MTADPSSLSRLRWRLDLICCGRADGHVVRETWTEADEFRRDYCNAGGHERAAILVEDHSHTRACNGYSDDCPALGASFHELRSDA